MTPRLSRFRLRFEWPPWCLLFELSSLSPSPADTDPF